MEHTRNATIELTGIEDIDIDRDMSNGVITLTLQTEAGETLNIYCGRFNEDASNLLHTLECAVTEAKNLYDHWEDIPDPDADAFVGEDRGRYYVQVEGVSIEGGNRPRGFLTQTIAEIALAEWMAKHEFYPNCWFENERGNTFDINETIRKYHDEGGDKMLALPGAIFKEGQEAQARIYIGGEAHWVGAEIIRDYGDAGVTYCYSGDGDEHWTDDPDEIRAVDTCQHCETAIVFDRSDEMWLHRDVCPEDSTCYDGTTGPTPGGD